MRVTFAHPGPAPADVHENRIVTPHPMRRARFTREWKRIALPWAVVGIFMTAGPGALRAAGGGSQLLNLELMTELGLIVASAYFCFVAIWFRKRPVRIRPGSVARCLACLYPVEHSFDHCPECGADLRNADAVVRGDPEALGNGGALFILLAGLSGMGFALFLWFTR